VKKEFKAKYYPNCNFLDSALGYSPSFTWHSIHTSRVLVKNGIRWRLKDGKSINIWNDPWLRSNDGSYVQTPLTGLEELKVSTLMNSSSNKWNDTLIHQIFSSCHVTRILYMHICLPNELDAIIWKYNSDGNFTIKSCYFHAMETLIENTIFREWRLEFHMGFKHYWKQDIHG